VDLKTLMLMLSVGSFIFGILLVIIKFNKHNIQQVPYWIAAKFLQGTGSFILYFRTTSFDFFTVLANTFLLLGCAYEAWAVRILCGYPVRRKLHMTTAAWIVFVCFLTLSFEKTYRLGVVFLVQSIFYFLPGFYLANKFDMKHSLKLLLAVSYCVVGFVFLASSFLSLVFPDFALQLAGSFIAATIPWASFIIFLLSGFVLLMLAKERSDIQSLKKSEIRFQRIVETANEGILIFDESFNIIFANKNMAAILGYTVEEMLGKPYVSLFPKSQLDIYFYQESLRKNGEDSVYECCLAKKDGSMHWFLISAKTIYDDLGRFDGSFAVLTDINERKETELLLTESNRQLIELSNKDSLTGIANRRCFDITLEHEYSRLERSKSKLSVILFDVDYFKEYNDYYGHVKGDECLRQIGNVLELCINRDVDLAARYGGEEFACILPDTDIIAAAEIAEKIRQGILDLKIEHEKSNVSQFVTASFGVITVQYSSVKSPSEIITLADRLLYKAKAQGRNRVECGEMN